MDSDGSNQNRMHQRNVKDIWTQSLKEPIALVVVTELAKMSKGQEFYILIKTWYSVYAWNPKFSSFI